MTPEQRELLTNLENFPLEGEQARQAILAMLSEARDADTVELAMGLGSDVGFTEGFVDVLCRLAFADWHKCHEDVIWALDQLRTVKAIEAFVFSTRVRWPYLDFDDARALAVKAIWGLGNLGDTSADANLRLIADQADGVVRDNALKQLARRQS